jgi:hypothetical protein
MKTARLRIPLGWLGLVLSFMLSGGCSMLEPEGSVIIMTLTNRTGSPLWFQVLTSEEATRSYPLAAIPLSQVYSNPDARNAWERTLVEPEESSSIASENIDGDYRPGDTLVFFLYEVVDSLATNKGMRTFTHEQLKRQQFRVEILSF